MRNQQNINIFICIKSQKRPKKLWSYINVNTKKKKRRKKQKKQENHKKDKENKIQSWPIVLTSRLIQGQPLRQTAKANWKRERGSQSSQSAAGKAVSQSV